MLEHLLLAGSQATNGSEGGGNLFMSMLPIILIFVVFYFFLIRPQRKKQEEHQNMVNSLQKGNRVITSGGIKGKVVGVKEKEVVVKIAENVKIEVEKSYITKKED